MDENNMFLKVHSLEDPVGSFQDINQTQSQLISQKLTQDIKLHDSPVQWGYVIDTDSKLDIKLQNYESKPATITVIKIGGIEDLNPLNFANGPGPLNSLHQQVVIQDKLLVDQFQHQVALSAKLRERPKKKYIPQLHQPNSPAVVCQNCDASFSTKYQFQRHQCEFNASKVILKTELPKRQIEKPKTKHECDVCHKSFMTEHNLERHRLSHGDKKPFTCQNCGKGFVLESRLNTHVESHCKLAITEPKRFYKTDLSVWQCWICQLITATEPKYLIHICDLLNPTFISSKPIMSSTSNNIPEQNQSMLDPNLVPIYSPKTKDLMGTNQIMQNLTMTKVLHQSNGELSQNNFDKNFEKAIDVINDNSNDNFYKNLIIQPEKTLLPEKQEVHTFKMISVEQLFQCEFCNRTYANKEILKDHQNSHGTDRNYQCMFCNESFESFTNALIHWQHKCDLKTNLFCLPKIIICKFCDKGFKSHELLYAHKYKLKHFVPKVYNVNGKNHISIDENRCPVISVNLSNGFSNPIFNRSNEIKPSINVRRYSDLSNNSLYSNQSFVVNGDFSTDFQKDNLLIHNSSYIVSDDSNYHSANSTEILQIGNYSADDSKRLFNSTGFSEEEIRQNISPIHDANQNEMASIDEFLNDIANKVLNKNDSGINNASVTISEENNIPDAVAEEIVITEPFSPRKRQLHNHTQIDSQSSVNKDLGANRTKKSEIEVVEDKVKEEYDEQDVQIIGDNEDTSKKIKLNQEDVVKIEQGDEIPILPEQKMPAGPAKRGRKPKPKLPSTEVVLLCNEGYRFQCEKCAIVTRSIDELIEHRQADHGSNFDCKDCGQVVHSAKALMIHCRAHQSLKPFVCDQCGRSYSQTSHLWQHMRFHQGIKPFACPHEGCEARYTIRPDLKDHIRKVHTRERPFRCAVCGKCFLTGSVYYQHRLIHNNDRRYGCDMCGKRFFRADALNNHRRIHTDERPFPCPVCGREFRQKGDRNKHHRTQHPAELAMLNASVSQNQIPPMQQFSMNEPFKVQQ